MKDNDKIELINRAKNGDVYAFQQLYESYYDTIYRKAMSLCKCDADAKDATQETFIELHRSLPRLRNPLFLSLWLNRVVVSKCANLFRRNKYMNLPNDHYLFENNLVEHRSYAVPNKNMHYQTDIELLEMFISELDSKYQEIFILYYGEDIPIKEIAEQLHIPEGTVKSRMNTAKVLLRRRIKQYESKNEIKLDFRELVFPGVGTMSFLGVSGRLISHSKNFLLSCTAHSTTLLVASSILIVAGVSVYAVNNLPESENEALRNQRPSIMHIEKFQPVTVDNITYGTAFDAYYGIRRYAHCKEELLQMPKSEKQRIEPLVNALKAEQGTYWALLEESEWLTIFYQ